MATEKLHHADVHEEDPPRDMATRFHESLRKEHPRALESLNAAVDLGPDYSKGGWLDPRKGHEKTLQEAREIVQGLREFVRDLSSPDQYATSGAVADVMTLPLQRAVSEFKTTDQGAGLPEHWGEGLSPAGVNLEETIAHHWYMLRCDIVQDQGEKWTEHLQGLRDAAQDLVVRNFCNDELLGTGPLP